MLSQMERLLDTGRPLGGLSGDKPAPNGLRVPLGAGSRDTMIAGDAYEGASVRNRELAMWNPQSRSADGDILPNKRSADSRVRDSMRNDAYVKSGKTLHQDNIVGALYTLNAAPATKILIGKDDEKWEEEFQEEVEARFTLGVESEDNWIDACRRNNFTQLIRQGVGTYLSTGEILAAAEWEREKDSRRPFKTSIRMIDVDRLGTPPTMLGKKNLIGGVEVSDRHVPIAYHFRKAHQTDYTNPNSYMWDRVEARKPWGRYQVIHLFDQDRPDQTRGISDMVSALKEMRQTKDFRDVVLQNAVTTATYAAAIESDLPTAEVFARLGGGNLASDEADFNSATTQYMTAYLGAVKTYMGESNQFQLGGVKIPHLPPGSKLHLHGAGKGGPLGTEFEKSLLRYIAAILGVSYEQLSHDFSDTNYSSAKAAMVETQKYMASRKRLVADRLANHIYRLWLEEQLNRGFIQSLPARMKSSLDWLYEPLGMDAIANCTWIGAGKGQIDELKETQAQILKLKYHLSTHEVEHGRSGRDWRVQLKQARREAKILKEYDLEQPEDNAINAASGSKSVNEAKPVKSDSSDKKAQAGELNGTLENDFFDAVHDEGGDEE